MAETGRGAPRRDQRNRIAIAGDDLRVISIAAMAGLGLQLGGVWTGLAVGVLTTFHPWHVRYSAEARNYGMLMLALPLLFLALHRAMRSGSWRAWLGFGLAQYFCMALFLGIAHFLTVLNLVLAGMALRPAVKERCVRLVSWPLLVPATVAGLLAAAVYLAVNFPLFWQSAHFLERSTLLHGSFSPDWFKNAASLLAFGIPARDDDPENLWLLSVGRLAAQSPALTWAAVALVSICFTAGFRGMLRGGATGAIVAMSGAGGGALTVLFCHLRGLLLLDWYSIFLLPCVVLVVAAGFVRLARPLRFGVRIPLCLCALLPAVVWGRAIHSFTHHGRENLRAPVELTHGSPYPASRENPAHSMLRVLWSESPVYDWTALLLRSDDELQTAIDEARGSERPLFVEHGSPKQVERSFPRSFRRLNDPEEFELVQIFHGLDAAETTHRLYRLRPKSPDREDTRTTATPPGRPTALIEGSLAPVP